jgi:hypothetical protein
MAGRFEELSKDLYKVVNTLIKNQKLCKLLVYEDDSPLSHNDITNTVSLINTKIFTIPKLPVAEKDGSLIVVYLDNFRAVSNNPYFKSSKVVLDVIVHNNLFLLPEMGEFRPLAIMNEIDETLNGKLAAGLWEMEFDSGDRLFSNEFFTGHRISYNVLNFNR